MTTEEGAEMTLVSKAQALGNLLDAETLNRKSHDQLSSAIASYQIALEKYRLKVE